MRMTGIGTAVPPNRIAQADAAAISRRLADVPADQERQFDALYRRTGVQFRHSVLLDAPDGPPEARHSFYGEASPSTAARMERFARDAPPLALEASRSALADAGVAPERVTHLVTVSCTGFHAPGVDIALAKQLPLRASIARTHVGFMGCQGALNGLRVARAFVDADPRACVLLCAAELCSLHHHYGRDPEKIVANALFADGSAAVVLTGSTEEPSRRDRPRVVASASKLIDDSEDAMSWRIGDLGFAMTLSPRVPALISENVVPFLDQWLMHHGLSVGSIGSWAIHPGGPRILAAFGEAVGLPRAALAPSYEILAEYGNMSSATVVFIWKRLIESGASRPIVTVAFGPGLTVEAALLV
jgi:prepilin-type processing-associated H-X9-DG protein